MPRSKKKLNVLGEKAIRRFIEKKTISPADFNPCCLTKELFLVISLYGSAVIIVLICFFSLNFLMLAFTKKASDAKNLSVLINESILNPAGNIIYTVDKQRYKLDEKIGLSIINESSKSIFLAPCQYFNKFEKKELNSWKAIVININSCKAGTAENSNDFEKISQKENQNIAAADLGIGLWRGVSDVYIDCQKAEISACRDKKIVYSSEFTIDESGSKEKEIEAL